MTTPTYFAEAAMLFGIPFGTYLAVGSALIAVGRIIEDRFVEQYLADGL